VKKLPFAHTCGSANKSDKKKGKARMANKDWIADRGKAIMQEEVTLTAKGLREQLQKEYNMKLEYSNVWKKIAMPIKMQLLFQNGNYAYIACYLEHLLHADM
jgi:glutamate formiminotransferase